MLYGNNVVPVTTYNNRLQVNQWYATIGNDGNHFLNALNALKRKRCDSFYGGQGSQTLDATRYRFLNMSNPTTGAATITPNNVFVNSQGPYMTYTPTPGQTGPFDRYWSQGQFRGFVLLHELGHQLSPVTGFKPDAGSPLNQQQSQQVLKACF